ncbi:MAG: hypothetical protein IJE53_06560 [Bacilli bacterium]|nr:hypothetical protein [Bacilli bacterium]
MNEFEQKDFEAARNCADLVKTDADSILAIFDNVDQTMKLLYGEAWQSSGADVSNGRYQQIRKNYEVFYNNVVTMKDHIYRVTSKNESADAAISDAISNI